VSGSHRARWTLRALLRSVIGPVTALVAVGAFIGVLVLLNGKPDLGGSGPAVQPPSTSLAEGVDSPSPSAAPTSRPSVRTPSAAPTAAVSPTATTPAPASAGPLRAPLTVLNNSTESGLAADAAARFRAGGWTVATVGNFTGRIPETTVYYDPGQEPVARALAAQFPAIARVLPRFAGLPGAGLTVVVTREFPR